MKRTLLSLAAGLALLAVQGAYAQGYAGIGIGPARISTDCTGTTTCDNSSTGWKLYGGYRSGNVAGELVYFDWGKATATLGPDSAEIKGTGFGAGVALFAPLAPDWQGVLRLGVARNKAKGTLVGVGSTSETSTNPYYGFGIGYRVSGNLSIDAGMDFSRIKLAGEKANTRLFSVGLSSTF